MRKVTISVILFLIASFALHGQLLPSQVETQDVTLTKDFKAAKSTFIGGLVTAGVGALAALVACRGAALNVRINSSGLADKAPAKPLLDRAAAIVEEARALEAQVLAAVDNHIGD